MSRLFHTLPTLGAAWAALALTTPAAAQDRQPPTPADYRHSVMEGMQTHQGALRMLLTDVVDHPEHVVLHAEALHALATMVADVWPEGTSEGTRALPEIWENWADFTTRLTALREATERLAAAARSGDRAATEEAAGTVQQTCRSCHGEYRARAN